jgi:aspartyl protease family protein
MSTNEMPRTLKVVTLWLLLGTGLFLAVQAWLAQRERARFQSDGMGTVTLQRGPDGHFHWPGRVNGRPLEFLVDTGATRTALPGRLAEQLRLERGRELRSSTAGGAVRGYEAKVDLQLDGGFVVRQLRVTVLPDLAAPLLGMDVLSRLRFSQQQGTLRLEPAHNPPN